MSCGPLPSSVGRDWNDFGCKGSLKWTLWRGGWEYRKIPIISPGLIFVQKAFLLGWFSGELIFGGACYRKEFWFQNGFVSKNSNSNSPWASIREGLLLEGYLHLRFGGLIFGRAYYRNFRVCKFTGCCRVLHVITFVQDCKCELQSHAVGRCNHTCFLSTLGHLLFYIYSRKRKQSQNQEKKLTMSHQIQKQTNITNLIIKR